MSDYKSESRHYEVEVDAEAARLIRDGVASPWEAVRIAGERVRERRRRRSATPEQEPKA